MKRNVCIIMTMIFCLMVFMPVPAHAKTYNLGGIDDMSVQLDDSSWYVFTRDNIKNNSELVELGLSYEIMYDALYNNEAYMYAILFYDNGEYFELVVKKRTIEDGAVNVSNYSYEKVLGLAEDFAKRQNSNVYSVYENRYKFTKIEYIDKSYYLCDFFTSVNKDCYTFTFQSKSRFYDSEYVEMEKIIDTVRFSVDKSLEEKKNNAFWDSVVEKTIAGAVIGGVVGAIIAIANKKKKNSNKDDRQSCDDNIA